MANILNLDEFSKLEESINIKPVTKTRLDGIKKSESEWMSLGNFPETTRNYAEFQWEAYARIQKNIENHDYSVSVHMRPNPNILQNTVRFYGKISKFNDTEWHIDFDLEKNHLYKVKATERKKAYLGEHPIWWNGSVNTQSEDIKKEKEAEHGMKFLSPNELLCPNGKFEGIAKDALDAVYNAHNVWQSSFKKIVEDRLTEAIPNATVIVNVRRYADENLFPTVYVGLNKASHDINSGCVFVFDLEGGKIDCQRNMHLTLSPFDRSGENTYKPHLKYMAMRSSDDLLKECGLKHWRKVSYKTAQDIVKKISEYVNRSFSVMDIYCGHDVKNDDRLKGVLDISIADAYNQAKQ